MTGIMSNDVNGLPLFQNEDVDPTVSGLFTSLIQVSEIIKFIYLFFVLFFKDSFLSLCNFLDSQGACRRRGSSDLD